MDSILTINPGLIVWTIVSFVLLVVILGKVAWGPILKALDAREQAIAKSVRDADEARQKAEALLAEQKAFLAKSLAEADEHRAKSQREAEAQVAAMLTDGQSKAEALLERAKREIAQQEEQAIAAVRTEASRLAIDAASRLIKRNLDSEDNRRLVKDFIDGMEKRDVK